MHRRILILLVSLVMPLSVFAEAQPMSADELYAKIHHNMGLFGDIYREISLRYVDQIDPDEFVQAGIEGMLQTLDPYTVYIPEEDTEDLDVITFGKYGGVGIEIGVRGEEKILTVISAMDDSPAQRVGIRSGDRVIEVDAVLKQSPEFFERLVLDVLIKMGYGGSREAAADHMGRSGDEGIDGRINQDALGLDQILVQAKRYAPENTIDRKTIQAFIGSLAGQGVSKGIFITTSSFAESAREFVQRGAQTKIVLIDGDDLLDLMLRHHVGVRVERSIEVLDLDQNYFEDE